MKKFSYAIFFICSMIFLPSLAQASEVADKIQERYESVKSFEATFDQEQTRATINISTQFSGRIWFEQPQLIRWETLEPEEARETIVVGKDEVWDYLEELNTATKMLVPDLLSSKTLIRFISGTANLKDDFTIEEDWAGKENLKEWTDQGLIVLRLLPNEPEPQMMLAYIGVDPETYLLKRIMTVDYQWNANEMILNNLEINKEVDPKLFEFTPPADAVINDQTKPQTN